MSLIYLVANISLSNRNKSSLTVSLCTICIVSKFTLMFTNISQEHIVYMTIIKSLYVVLGVGYVTHVSL